MDEVLFLYTTWPEAETAAAAGRAAVEAGLAACANILAPMRSVHRWEGKVEEAGETPAIFKTVRSRVEALRALILERHPYEVPCVACLPVDPSGSNAAFLTWIGEETR